MSDNKRIGPAAQQMAEWLTQRNIRVNCYSDVEATILEIQIFKDIPFYIKFSRKDEKITYYVEDATETPYIDEDLPSVGAVSERVLEDIEALRNRERNDFQDIIQLVETASDFQVDTYLTLSTTTTINRFYELVSIEIDEYCEIRKSGSLHLDTYDDLRTLESFDEHGEISEPPQTIKRYIETNFPQSVQLGVPQALSIRILCRKREGSFYPRIHLTVPSKSHQTGEVPIDVYLRFDPTAFECDGSNVQRVAVSLKADSKPVIFKLTPKSEGVKTLTIEIYQNNSYIGDTQIQTTVGHPGILTPNVHSTIPVSLPLHNRVPDLTLRVAAAGLRDGKLVYRFELSSPHPELNLHFHDGGETTFTVMPTTYLEDIRREINELASQVGNTLPSNTRLARIGADLYTQLFPSELQRLYWEKWRERVQTLYIVSDEPWIPWEMLKPWRRLPDGMVEEDEFLCERFALTRWLVSRSFACSPAYELPLCRMKLLADATLHYADEEIEALRRFSGWVIDTVPLTRNAVDQLLETGGFDGLHFACHGEYNPENPDDSVLHLEDSVLHPNDISGLAQQFGRDHPLIFLNACDVAQQGLALTGLGGWVHKFLQAGSGAFVGPAWEATSASAKTFAIAFYHFLCEEGKPIAEAARLARATIKEDGNPTWLSYVVYAHPTTQVSPQMHWTRGSRNPITSLEQLRQAMERHQEVSIDQDGKLHTSSSVGNQWFES